MNDFMEAGHEVDSGLRPLLESGQMVNVIERLPPAERWTHFYKGGKKGDRHKQLDYILISNSLAQRNPNALPKIERRGQSLRVNEIGLPPRVLEFFEGVDKDTKASDHCPVAITLEV
jgi:exonuclease III